MNISKFQLNFASGTNRDKASLMNRIWNKIVEVNYKSQFMFSVINGHAYLWQLGHSITASMSTVFTALEKKVFMINFLGDTVLVWYHLQLSLLIILKHPQNTLKC